MYEGDSIIRSPATPQRPGSARPAPSLLEGMGKEAFGGPYVDFVEVEKRARRIRAQALSGLFARLFDWIDASVRRAKYRELEKYLGESTDLADLERRLRRIGTERRNLLARG